MEDKIYSRWTSKVEVNSHEDSAGEFCCVESILSIKLLGFVSNKALIN